jgi:hypothetical protein
MDRENDTQDTQATEGPIIKHTTRFQMCLVALVSYVDNYVDMIKMTEQIAFFSCTDFSYDMAPSTH